MLRPKLLDPEASVDLVLHLHGHTSRSWDPFAGWRQHRKATPKGDDKQYRQVRDVDLDRIAQQMGATKNPQVMTILAQGVGHSEYGGLVPDTYVPEVLKRLEDIGELPKRKDGSRPTFNLILSGHSGAGATIAKALRAEVAAAQPPAAPKRGRKAPPPPPVPGMVPVEVVLFEAINGPGELSAVTEWVDLHLDRVGGALATETDPAKRAVIVAGCPILRAYRSRDMYVTMYDNLATHLRNQFAKPARITQLGADLDRVRARFKVEVIEGLTGSGGHEKSVGGLGTPEQGPLADALNARKDPTASKLLKVPPKEDEKNRRQN